MSETLKLGQFPILQSSNRDKFVKHQQSMPQWVTLEDGTRVETGYVKITSDETVDLYTLCQNTGNAKTLSVKEVVYIDEGDNLKVHEVKRMAPTVLNDPAYRNGITIGFVTKLCNLRWGFNLVLNPQSGHCRIEVDRESPIVGLKLQFD